MTDPRVTVLMPIYRGADLLKTSLRTVLAQTIQDIEVIVSGDGCIDESAEVVRQCGDSRAHWLGFPKAPGVGYENRARALARARGKLIAYLAPDDLWAPHHLETLLHALESRQLEFVFARPAILRPNGCVHTHAFAFDMLTGVPVVHPRLYFLSSSQVLHTRAVYDRVGGWTTPLHRFGDVDLWLRMYSAGAAMGLVTDPTVIRLPAHEYRHIVETERTAIHGWAGEQILTGQSLQNVTSWPLERRACQWISDITRLSLAKGPAFVRSRWLSARARRWSDR